MGDSTTNNSNAGGGAANTTNNTTTTPNAADAGIKTDAGTGATIDTSKFTQADWDKIYGDPKLYEHSRFKSLNDQAKEAKTLREEKDAAERKKLEDEKRYQELAQKNADEAKNWRTRAETSSINNAIILEAGKQGAVDSDAVVQLIDRKDLKLNDDGSVSGVADAVKNLLASKTYLTGKGKTTRIGGGTGPSDQDTTTPRFKHSQLKDPVFFRKHQKEIQEALRLNLVVDDLAPGNRA